jgi:hypothetical protein
MTRLCFLGIPEHGKTRSTDFLKNLLEQTFELETVEETPSDSLIDETEIFLFFQRPPSIDLLKRLKGKRIIYVPMYDEARNYNRQVIRTWAPYKIISFCRSMHEDLCAWGFNSKYIQYFPKPMVDAPLPVDIPKAFFWRRENSYINEAIPDTVINTLLHGTGMKLHYHSELLDRHTCGNMVASQSSWMADKEELATLMRACSLYIAPRESEGIGMSFLDAMANGLAVAGANNPTMNEYITDGVNGYLFDLMHPGRLDLCNLQQVRKRSLETCSVGYEKWERDKWSLIDFIEAPYQTPAQVQVPRNFEYRSLKQKDVRFTIKRLVKRLVGK